MVFLSCLCLEGDENGQEQDGHAEKRSAEEEEVSSSECEDNSGEKERGDLLSADQIHVDATAESLKLASGLIASAADG